MTASAGPALFGAIMHNLTGLRTALLSCVQFWCLLAWVVI